MTHKAAHVNRIAFFCLFSISILFAVSSFSITLNECIEICSGYRIEKHEKMFYFDKMIARDKKRRNENQNRNSKHRFQFADTRTTKIWATIEKSCKLHICKRDRSGRSHHQVESTKVTEDRSQHQMVQTLRMKSIDENDSNLEKN